MPFAATRGIKCKKYFPQYETPLKAHSTLAGVKVVYLSPAKDTIEMHEMEKVVGVFFVYTFIVHLPFTINKFQLKLK